MDEATRTTAGEDDQPRVALVVKGGEMTVGLVVDRLDGILSAGASRFVPSDDPDEHPMVHGFLETTSPGAPVVTVLEPRVVVERLEAIKYTQADEEMPKATRG